MLYYIIVCNVSVVCYIQNELYTSSVGSITIYFLLVQDLQYQKWLDSDKIKQSQCIINYSFFNNNVEQFSLIRCKTLEIHVLILLLIRSNIIILLYYIRFNVNVVCEILQELYIISMLSLAPFIPYLVYFLKFLFFCSVTGTSAPAIKMSIRH